MNIHELNAIADNIRAVDASVRKVTFEDLSSYAVKKHNEMVKMMRDVYAFVEANFDLFDSIKIVWNGKSRNRQYHNNYDIGTANGYNCVLRDMHHERYNPGERIYWVDDGIIFRLRESDMKICYLTDCDRPREHGYGEEAKLWNDGMSFTQFNHYMVSSDGGSLQWGGVRIPDWDKSMWDEGRFCGGALINELNADQIKRYVDHDLEHAERVVEKLAYTLKRIGESVQARQGAVAKTLDSANRDMRKTTEIRIVIDRNV